MPYRYDDTEGTTFTTGGLTGRTGPSELPYTYATVTQGIQIWTVPVTGLYEIIAAGAAGQNASNSRGGRGAIISTIATLTAGQRIKILVGQLPPANTNWQGGGGGGGTFVATFHDIPILVAGGGGGGGGTQNPLLNATGLRNGLDAVITTTGLQTGTTPGGPGTSGTCGAGGAGFESNATAASSFTFTTGARSFKFGGDGGTSGSSDGRNDGGFGGGGSSINGGGDGGAGGGGGYTGGNGQIGGGGENGGFFFPYGAGGGSYDINGVNNNATRYTTTINGQTEGFNTGNGFVRITPLPLKFYSIESTFDVTCTFPSPVEMYYYKIQSNLVKWELIGLDRVRDDAGNLTYTCTIPGSRTSVTLRIQRISGAQPVINTLEFYDRYMRRVMPALTAQSAYYTANPITDRPCTHNTETNTFESKTGQSVSVEFIYVKPTTAVVQARSDVNLDINKVISADATTFTYTGNPSYIELFDASGSPLSDTAYVGGGIRVPEWVEVEFQESIAARSYYFKTPIADRHPTWWVIKGWNGNAWIDCSPEKKHMYDDFIDFSDALLPNVTYAKYRLYIYAMKGREAADIVLFNLYDENGTEFIRLENQSDDNRTNADIVSSQGWLRDGVVYTSPISITFRVPVRVRKVACVSLTGEWRLNGSATLNSANTVVDITAKTFTLTPLTSGASLRTPELHGSYGRLNPILDVNRNPQNTYGGKSLSNDGITFRAILPTSITTYGNHYQLTTTANATIVDFELRGYKADTIGTLLVRQSNLYARNVSISGSFNESNYSTYEVRIREVSAVTLPQKKLEIIDFSILSNTYVPVLPIFTGQNVVDITRELPVSIHGNYQIAFTGSTRSPFSNIFDGNPESIFTTDGPFTLQVTFPYATHVSAVHVSFEGLPITSWSLTSDGVTIASGTGTATIYTGLSQTFTEVRLTVDSDQSVRLVDFRLLNDRGEFIPKITGSGPSTRSQFLYGGTTTETQTITFEIPEPRKVQRIVFRGQSLPSNVLVRNATDQIIGSSDSFTGESSVTVNDPQFVQRFSVRINRIRTTDSTQRFQNIRLSDILIYDASGYIITPEVYPNNISILEGGRRIQYTVVVPTRKGYIYETAQSISLATIDGLQSRNIYGYRGRFIGAKTVQVRYDGIPNHEIRFDAPFSNVYSNVFDAPMNPPLSNISFGVLSTFEGFQRAGIGNLNLFDQSYEPVFFEGSRIGGKVRDVSIPSGTVNVTYTFRPQKTIETVTFETSKPAVCFIDTPPPQYLPFGTYRLFGSSTGTDAFMGGYSILRDNTPVRLHFPRKMAVDTVTFTLPEDNDQYQFSSDVTFTINGVVKSINTLSRIIRNVTLITFPLKGEYTSLSIQGVKIGSYSIGVSDIRINGLSLKNHGIVQGSIIEYIPPTTHSFPVNRSVNTLTIQCSEYYNDLNVDDGRITIKNVTVGNLFNGFTSNVKSSYEYDATDTVPGSSWVEMDLDVSRTIAKSSHTWDLSPSFSRPVGNVLQVFTPNGWIKADLPVEGRRFRQFVPSVTNFTNSGRIRLSDWRLDTFPGEAMTSNIRGQVDILENPSFGTLSGTPEAGGT